MAGRIRGVTSGQIKAAALGLAIGGGICLYFGMTLVADAPGSATPEEAERWFALDNGLFWLLRGVGVLFILSAGLAAMGQRGAMLLGTVCEVLLVLWLVAMSVVWTIEARADGVWNYQVILLLIIAAVSVGGAKRSWGLYSAAGQKVPPDEGLGSE